MLVPPAYGLAGLIAADAFGFDDRQRSEQYLTSSHTRSHFLRHANGRPQVTQSLPGNVDFVKRFGALGFTSGRNQAIAAEDAAFSSRNPRARHAVATMLAASNPASAYIFSGLS